MDGIHEGETAGEQLARLGTDAATWAREFVDAVRRIRALEVADPGPSGPMSEADIVLDPAPGEFLHRWMVGALEAGRAAGYSAGRRDAEWKAARAYEHVNDSHGYNTAGDAARGAAREIVDAVAWPLPADSAGRPPEDSAGRTQAADLAGRNRWCGQAQPHPAHGGCSGYSLGVVVADRTEALREALKGPLTVLPPSPPSDVSRAADALENIARSLAEVTAAQRRSGDLRGRT